jgi:hypothetical protein
MFELFLKFAVAIAGVCILAAFMSSIAEAILPLAAGAFIIFTIFCVTKALSE